ncbi:AlpA family phage regulatory protein [Variovorax paradoxus]|uniref:helix-turn-helix transcriptional regulator n=1 Tax=Variovorax paradoxus TaxID=34073 RepID=UPI003AABB59E
MAALLWFRCRSAFVGGLQVRNSPSVRKPLLEGSTQLQGVVLQFEPHANHRHVDLSSATGPAFFRMADVIRITALSRATLYRRIAGGKFPPPVHLGGRACGWPRGALQRWIDDPEGYSNEALVVSQE